CVVQPPMFSPLCAHYRWVVGPLASLGILFDNLCLAIHEVSSGQPESDEPRTIGLFVQADFFASELSSLAEYGFGDGFDRLRLVQLRGGRRLSRSGFARFGLPGSAPGDTGIAPLPGSIAEGG